MTGRKRDRTPKGSIPKKKSPTTKYIAAGGAAAAIIVGIVVAFGYTGNAPKQLVPTASIQETNSSAVSSNSLSFASLNSSGAAVKGNSNAKVTLVEFGDFQCEFCDRYATQTEPQIDQQYIATGKINAAFLHFAWYGSDSTSAAIASQCLNEQGKFWEFHDILYKSQGAINSGWASPDNLRKFASGIPGVDMGKYDSCVGSGKYDPLVQKDVNLAKSLGFQGTPGFIVEHSDGSSQTLLPGAYPFSTFQQAIDQKLASG